MPLAQWYNAVPLVRLKPVIPIGQLIFFFQNFHIPILSSDFIYDLYLDFANS